MGKMIGSSGIWIFGNVGLIDKKTYKKVCTQIRKADKEQVLKAWNAWKVWSGDKDKYYITKQGFVNLYNAYSPRNITNAKKWDRNLQEYNSRKGYVVMHKDGFIQSEGKFFSKNFVDLEDVDFVITVVDYHLAGLLE